MCHDQDEVIAVKPPMPIETARAPAQEDGKNHTEPASNSNRDDQTATMDQQVPLCLGKGKGDEPDRRERHVITGTLW